MKTDIYTIIKRHTLPVMVTAPLFLLSLYMIAMVMGNRSFDDDYRVCCAIPPTYLETIGISEESFPEIEGFETVEILDKKSSERLIRITIPVHWQLDAGAVLDKETGLFETYHLGLTGPEGQVLRRKNTIYYSPDSGGNFDEIWKGLIFEEAGQIMSGIEIDTLHFSKKQRNESRLNTWWSSIGIEYEPLQVAFHGAVNKQKWSGWAYIVHGTYINIEDVGMVEFRIIYGPEEMHEQLDMLDTYLSQKYFEYKRMPYRKFAHLNTMIHDLYIEMFK